MGYTKTCPQNYPSLSDAQIELGVLSPLGQLDTEEGVAAEAQGPKILNRCSRGPRTQGTGEEATTGHRSTSLSHKFGLLQGGSMLWAGR